MNRNFTLATDRKQLRDVMAFPRGLRSACKTQYNIGQLFYIVVEET